MWFRAVVQSPLWSCSEGKLLRCTQGTQMGFGSGCFDLLIHFQRIKGNVTWDHSLQFSSAQPETQSFFWSWLWEKMHVSVFGLALRRQSLLTKNIGNKSLHGTFRHENVYWPDLLSCGKGWMSEETQLKTFYRNYDFFFFLEVDFVTVSGNAKWRCCYLLNSAGLRTSPHLTKSF